MGLRYVLKQQNITPTAGNDVMTIVSGASQRIRLISVSVAGRGSSSAAQQLEIGRSTGGTTGGGAITPGKWDNQDIPAAAATVNTTWSAQPTLDVNTEVLGWNALGGANKWTAMGLGKGGSTTGIEVRGGDNISIRASAGVTFQAASISVIYEEG